MRSTVVVTGGAGFIGSCLVRELLSETEWRVVNLDNLSYSGNRASVRELDDHPRYRFVEGDIGDEELVASTFADERPSGVFHLAAETHVDRSIDGPMPFVDTNVRGTTNLLTRALEYWEDLPEDDRDAFRFLQVSTDEVYGELGETGAFTEQTPYSPRNPYAASKASADFLARSFHETYGLPILITNCANNYGPRQFPEKLIPVVLLNALRGDPIPVYGDGTNVRDWIHVRDHARGLTVVFEEGEIGETYNIGAECERQNIELVRSICEILDGRVAEPAVERHEDLIEFVEDRPGHDARYAIDASKIREELGWEARRSFDEGMRATVEWYLENLDWCEEVMEGEYDLERLGNARGIA